MGEIIDDGKVLEGEEFWIRLTVVTPYSRNYVVLEDFLPAGFESINESLKNTSTLGIEEPDSDSEDSLDNYWRSYYFDRKEYRDGPYSYLCRLFAWWFV